MNETSHLKWIFQIYETDYYTKYSVLLESCIFSISNSLNVANHRDPHLWTLASTKWRGYKTRSFAFNGNFSNISWDLVRSRENISEKQVLAF